MARAILLVMDSFGIGASLDASAYGDAGANTLGHIAEKCPLHLPHLTRLGLNMAAIASSGQPVKGLERELSVQGAFGYAVEISKGKDTPSGHWEMAGVPVLEDWGYFPLAYPSFPPELIANLIAEAELPGVLGNKHASGTAIINELGDEHFKTGKPIVYTSADSVFQIAAHEESFGLTRLYHVCEIARKLVDPYRIGRVIARPFLGSSGNFYRTANRKDLATPPPMPTLLDHIIEEGGQVLAIGKIADIFAHQGITEEIKADGNMALFDATLKAVESAPDNTLIFANFVDFDMLYGHRRDPLGYAAALEAFDQRLPELEQLLQPGDIVIIAADHGCDPTYPGSDHTREHIPVLLFGPEIEPGFLGRRDSFADIGQSIAKHFAVKPLAYGLSFI